MWGAEGPEHCIYLQFEQKQKKLYYCLKVIDIIIQTWYTRLREPLCDNLSDKGDYVWQKSEMTIPSTTNIEWQQSCL